MSADEEEAALRRLVQWRKSRASSHPPPDSTSPPPPPRPTVDLPLPPCPSCQLSASSSSSSPLLLRWLSVLRCVHSPSASPHLRALARLPALDLVRALEESTDALERGGEELRLGLLHLLSALRLAVREEVAAVILSAAQRLRGLLRSSIEEGRTGEGGVDDSSAALLLLHCALVRVVWVCEQLLQAVGAEWLQPPLPPMLPPTAFAGADVIDLLPAQRPQADDVGRPSHPPGAAAPSSSRSRRVASLPVAALMVASLERLRCIADFVQGRLTEAPGALLPHLRGLREEATALASFIDRHLPCTCHHAMLEGKGERAEVVRGFGDLCWSLLRSSALSAFLSHLPRSAEVEWLTTLLTPCIDCMGHSQRPESAGENALSSSPPPAVLPPSAQSLMSQCALYEADAFRRSLQPALVNLLSRFGGGGYGTAATEEERRSGDEGEEEEGEEEARGAGMRGRAVRAGHRLRVPGGRKRRRSSPSPSTSAPLSPPPPLPSSSSSTATLLSLSCILRTWNLVPQAAWVVQPAQVEGEVQRSVRLQQPQPLSVLQDSVSVLVRSLLRSSVLKLAGVDASAQPLLARLATAEAWAELLRPLATLSPLPPPPLLTSTARLLAACTSASATLHSPSIRVFFLERLPAALLRCVVGRVGEAAPAAESASAAPPSALELQLSPVVATPLLVAAAVALIDAVGAGVRGSAAALNAQLSSTTAPTLSAVWTALEELRSVGEEAAAAVTLLRLPLLHRLCDRPAGLGQLLLSSLRPRVMEAEAAATDFAFLQLCERRSASTATAPKQGGGEDRGEQEGAEGSAGDSDASVRCAEWLLSRLLRWSRLCKRSSGPRPPLPSLSPSLLHPAAAVHIPPTVVTPDGPRREVHQWTALLLKAAAAQSSSSQSLPAPRSAPLALRLLQRALAVLARHSTRAEVDQQLLPAFIQCLLSSPSAALRSVCGVVCGLCVVLECGLSRARAPSPATVHHALRALTSVGAASEGRRTGEGEELPTAILLALTCVVRQPQAFPLTLIDGSLVLQCAVSCTSSHALAPSTSLALCQLLSALADHRLPLLTSSMALTLALLRRLLHTLPDGELRREGMGVQLATSLCRVVVHLSNASLASPSVLSHYWPYFIHDFLSLCRQSAQLPHQLDWQAALTPAMAACLALLQEHDLSALTLALPPPEKELFKQQLHTYKAQWQWKGE